jgi:hypothetical protein
MRYTGNRAQRLGHPNKVFPAYGSKVLAGLTQENIYEKSLYV